MSEAPAHATYSSVFKPGDLVSLKSGTRPMVVAFIINTEATRYTGYQLGVHCDWLDDFGKHQKAVLQPDQLVLCNALGPTAGVVKSIKQKSWNEAANLAQQYGYTDLQAVFLAWVAQEHGT